MREAPLRIALWGNFGTGNWGNECTLAAMLAAARRRLPNDAIAAVCSRPDDTSARHGVGAWPISARRSGAAAPSVASRLTRLARRVAVEVAEWSRMWHAVGRIDMLVVTGTGVLDDGEGPFGSTYELFRWSLLTRLRGGRVAFVSVGVEAMEHPVARLFVRAALRLAEYRSYRDPESRARLVRAGMSVGGDPIVPDLAFSLPVDPARAPPHKGAVAVGVYDFMRRGAAGAPAGAAYEGYLARVGGLVTRLLEQGRPVRLILGDLTYDEAVLEDVRAWLAARLPEGGGRDLTCEPARSVDEVLMQMAAADVVVATRFHNVLLALLLGLPVVSLGYDQKNDALMANMGLGRYCHAVASFDPERVAEQVSELEGTADVVRARLVTKAAEYRTQLERQYEALFGAQSGSSAWSGEPGRGAAAGVRR